MKVTLFTLLITITLLCSQPMTAHHSFAGTYDAAKEITIKGKIVEVSLRSPHSFFFVEAEDAKGTVQRWSIEGASASQFAQQGVTRDALKVGDQVEVIGNPARSMTTGFRARLLKITRPSDGWSWGTRPGEQVQ
jgi:DNA/RNA endonuclease YhcR with UshA esterase domain